MPDDSESTHKVTLALGLEGTALLESLDSAGAQAYASVETSVEWSLSCIYYHSTLLFLARDFTYYQYWEGKLHPSLTATETQMHVVRTVELAETLVASRVLGVLLLLPLRVAGSLATTIGARRRILAVLDSIYWKGFAVMQQVKLDLIQLWEYEGVDF